MSRVTRFCEWLLRQSTVWGGMACLAFYVLAVQNQAPDSALHRWFAGEGVGVKALCSLLFFTGAAGLAMRLFGVIVQFGGLERAALPGPTAEEGAADEVDQRAAILEQTLEGLGRGYLRDRLAAALGSMREHDSTSGLKVRCDELARADRQRMSTGYATTRTIVAAIGVIGVLGALMGASRAVGALATSGDGVRLTVSAGVQLALDCAGQSLGLASLMVMAAFGVQHVERRLLAAVDACLSGQFGRGSSSAVAGISDDSVAIRRMCERVLTSVETAISRHDASLTKTLSAAGRRWEDAATATSTLIHRTVGDALAEGLKTHAQSLNEGVARHTADLERTLIRHAEILGQNIDEHTGALVEALEHHTAVMTETEKTLTDENRRHLSEVEAALGEAMVLAASRQEKLIQQSEDLLKEMQLALAEAAGTTVAQQELLIQQGDVLLKVVEATGQICKLEDTLNSNLASLASSHHFEETVISLSATLQLLSANLSRSGLRRDDLSLDSHSRTSQAA